MRFYSTVVPNTDVNNNNHDDIEVPNKKNQNRMEQPFNEENSSSLSSSNTPLIITVVILMFGLFLHKLPYMSRRPTLLPGGGRDWIIDTTNRIITSKHHPELALGSLVHDPLVLTSRRVHDSGREASSSLLKFSKSALETLLNGECVPMSSMSLVHQFPNHFDTFQGEWDYMLTGVSSRSDDDNDDSKECNIEFIDENFIVLDGGDYALDVAFWIIEEGNTVNFVRTSPESGTAAASSSLKDLKKTFKKGGGSDWVINLEDGTISPKQDLSLALGRSTFRTLALMDVNTNADSVWTFDKQRLQKLKNGEGVMELVNDLNHEFVTKKYENQKIYNGWRYIESKVLSSFSDDSTAMDDAIKVKYIDDNYLAVVEDGVDDKEKALVLDVSFWRNQHYNAVNFVGGTTYD